MASTETLYWISQQLNRYVGIFMFVVGIVGALANLLVVRHHSLRNSSYCIYISFGAIASLAQLLFSLSDRIIDAGFGVKWTASSAAWCKIRYYIAHCASLTALSCFVLSAVDRFLSTCEEIRWRRLNSVPIAKRICQCTAAFCMIITIPTLVFARPMPVTADRYSCQNTSLIWSAMLTYFFNLCCYGIFPWLLTSLFGFLTWKNLRQKRTRRVGTVAPTILSRKARIDDQLASMLFLQIIICIISSIPYCTQSFYDRLTRSSSKTAYRQAQDYLFLQVARLTFYLNYVSAFYVNYLSSTIFRQVSKQVAANLWKSQGDLSREITIINHQERSKQGDTRR